MRLKDAKPIAAGLVVIGALLTLTSPALAAPPGQESKGAEPYVCDLLGPVDVYGPLDGRVAWIGDTRYLAMAFHAEGTFTPDDGGSPVPVQFDFAYGQGPPPDDLVHCRLDPFVFHERTGTFEGFAEVWAVEVPGQ